ncbi:MAG: DNA repair protein RadA [Pseudomonadota bacterium]
MAKNDKTKFICQNCGAVHAKWSGKCDACGAWDQIIEETVASIALSVIEQEVEIKSLAKIIDNTDEIARRQTGIDELDRVLGGGLVPGAAILLGGDPGIGKSTLLLQLAQKLVTSKTGVLYVSGEESASQIALRAKRLGLDKCDLQLLTATNLGVILAAVTKQAPPVVFIDSVQTLHSADVSAAPGTVSQVKICSFELIKMAKERGITVILVGHVTKEGQLAGPKVLEHMVDTVLYFEGERGHQFRILRSIKNRFGAVNEIGIFAMSSQGLEQVTNPSELFINQAPANMSGNVVFAGIEGTRPILVEIQALVSPSNMANPRRAVVGWDSNRLSMITAVLGARCNTSFADKDIYLNVAGGMKINEPAADLAVAAALISAISEKPLPPKSVIFGEVGLGGEIRNVPHAEERLNEAAKLGFTSGVVPAASKIVDSKQQLYRLEYLSELIKQRKIF